MASTSRTILTVGDIPTHWNRTSHLVMGIDEAGRGPVLGAMVYGGAFWPEEEDEGIRRMGFDDSKSLTPERRAELFESMKRCGRIGWITLEIAPEEISAKMLRRTPYNLNAISHDAAERLVREVQGKDLHVSHVFVDTVGHPGTYQRRLTSSFGSKVQFTVEKKADAKFPVVSAASIAAKVTRDTGMEHWEFREPGWTSQCPLGSGYPGDAVTKDWLRQHVEPVFGYPSIVRFSWATVRTILEADAVPVTWCVSFYRLRVVRRQASGSHCWFARVGGARPFPREEDDDEGAAGGSAAAQPITSFFGATARGADPRPVPAEYFRKRGLEEVREL